VAGILTVLVATAVLGLLMLASGPVALYSTVTKRSEVLTRLRYAWALGLAVLGLAVQSFVVVGLAALLAFGPLVSGWPGGVRIRSRGRRRTRIDPAAVGGVWSRLLGEALAARAQFNAAIRRAPRGAIRERLAELSGDVEEAVGHAWDRARRGAELERTAAEISGAARSSSRSMQRWGRGWRPLVEDQRVVDARSARDAAAQRLATSINEERTQLQVLVARLAEAACHAAELSVASRPAALGAGGPDDLAADLVDRLAALRSALVEASSTHPVT
jgi:hypothetical protein